MKKTTKQIAAKKATTNGKKAIKAKSKTKGTAIKRTTPIAAARPGGNVSKGTGRNTRSTGTLTKKTAAKKTSSIAAKKNGGLVMAKRDRKGPTAKQKAYWRSMRGIVSNRSNDKRKVGKPVIA